MAKQTAGQEAAELAERLRRYQHEYYVLGRPSIGDAEFDRLFDRLLALESEHPELVRPDSPTRRVGSDLASDLPEAPHRIPVLSLDKAYSAEDVGAWMRKTLLGTARSLGFVLEEKIDGAAVVLYYERGELARAVTRGNGYVGNDVTANVCTIPSVPLKLSRPVDIAVRGEIYLPRPLFERINATMEIPYANPRNLAAGTLRRVKSSEVARVPLSIFVYEGFLKPPPPTHVAVLELLEELGLRLNPRVGYFGEPAEAPELSRALSERHPEWMIGGLDDFARYLARERADRPTLAYDIDGIVAKVDDIEAREQLGYTGHHPKWELAFKFDAPEAVSTVTAIDVQVGRTGRITPVARVEPVRIAGSTVSNATLHNQEYVDLLDLAVGDTVAVSKRGDVIPAVERVLEKRVNEACPGAPTWKIPRECPSCGTELVKIGAHTFCPNTAGCTAQLRGRFMFFAARAQMDIQNLGPETIDALLERGLVKDLPDLYELEAAALRGIPGFGEKKASLVLEGLGRSRERPYRAVLPSLGIPELGPKVTEILVDAGYRSIDDLLRLADGGDVAPLTEIRGIGEKTAERILKELSDPAVRNRIDRLRRAGLRFEEPQGQAGSADSPAEKSSPFAGTVWCITGSFEHFQPRELAMDEVRRRGGRVSSSVTSATTHLLAGSGAGSKLARARELGAAIVEEAAFLQMLSP